MRCGLLGRHLTHSYSPQIHARLGSYPYELFEIEPEQIEDFLTKGDFTGLNVTIPYKKTVIPYCDQLSYAAKAVGAVNTIIRLPNGSLMGHNTDYSGFRSMVRRSGLTVNSKKVLVLGSGGVSAAAVAVLRELGAVVVVISRSGENNYENLHLHNDAAVIVNATPVGMYPDVDASPVELGAFPKLEGVLDVIYNPARTKLLMDAERRGLAAENGLWMLVAQAKDSAQWFTGKAIEDAAIEKIHAVLRGQTENIVLIGMPGCGKTTVGRLVAQALNRQFIDADAEIEKEAGCSIPELFASKGEQAFRALETKVLARLGKESGKIIATGGGCVTRAENYSLLHRNGRILWLQRSLDKLPRDGRPISMVNSIADIYASRESMYRSFADAIINNDTTPKEAAAAITALLQEETI